MLYEINHPVAKVVEPLKADAIAHAEQEANKTIQRVAKIIEDAGYDYNTANPYPKSWNVGRREYAVAKARYKLISSLVELKQKGINEWDAKISPAKADRFIELAKEEAAAAYDLYIAKLTKKIGACETAEISGSHIWGSSIIKVTFADKAGEKWKTQQIVNTSVLGKLFYQWPTRKVK